MTPPSRSTDAGSGLIAAASSAASLSCGASAARKLRQARGWTARVSAGAERRAGASSVSRRPERSRGRADSQRDARGDALDVHAFLERVVQRVPACRRLADQLRHRIEARGRERRGRAAGGAGRGAASGCPCRSRRCRAARAASARVRRGWFRSAPGCGASRDPCGRRRAPARPPAILTCAIAVPWVARAYSSSAPAARRPRRSGRRRRSRRDRASRTAWRARVAAASRSNCHGGRRFTAAVRAVQQVGRRVLRQPGFPPARAARAPPSGWPSAVSIAVKRPEASESQASPSDRALRARRPAAGCRAFPRAARRRSACRA